MSKGKIVAVCLVWLTLIGFGAITWKMLFQPAREKAQQAELDRTKQAEEERKRRELELAGSPSRYKYTINFHLDSFSGYAILRDKVFQSELAQFGIRLNLVDDNADYSKRLAALDSGEAQMAAFTIDALIKTSATAGTIPASIVALIDETTGADAIVAYKDKYPNIDALNNPETQFILTPDSPSETLTRVVMSRFNLERLGGQPFQTANDAGEVFDRYKQSKPTDSVAYVLWEPYVSQVLANPETHILADSSQFPSTIVDVIVASRDFIVKQPEVVKEVVKAYLSSVYRYRDREKMVELVVRDAKATGSPVTTEQAIKLVDAIWWKNTQENLVHVGLLTDKSLPYLEDMIANLTGILLSTEAIPEDPVDGKYNLWFYSKALEDLKTFHPGDQMETVRDIQLPPLSDAQWKQLTSIGTAKVTPLVFARGTDRLTGRSKAVLDDLATSLNSTRLYVSIIGNASTTGNLEQNKKLAESRARVAQDYLISKGVHKNRIRALGSEPSGMTSVTFRLGQLPY